jgi:hypothetical protein
MNTLELQHRFNLEMEKHSITDPVMSTIIEDYINYAYQNYVTEKYDSLINNVEKFEITERISRILAPLLEDFTSAVFTSITTNSEYGYYVTAPATLQYIIKEKMRVSYTDCNGDTALKDCKVVTIKHNMITENLDNPFLKPKNGRVWRVNFSDNKIELLLYSGATPVQYSCRYLKKIIPVSFPDDTTIEIDDSVHEEIVVRASYMYLADLRNSTNEKKEND